MSGPLEASVEAPTTADLRRALGRVLVGRSRRVVSLERRPSDYRSSCAVEELRAGIDGGAEVRVVFKDLAPRALLAEASRARPAFLFDPRREIETYRRALAPIGAGTAEFYGAEVDPARERYWLFLEHVPGSSLWQVGDLAIWCEAAAWLASFHARFARTGVPPELRPHLVRHDADFYRIWLDRAIAFARPASAGRLDWLAARYDRAVERLTALPATLIHGELYPSNVLVRPADPAGRICPIDWETAGLGSGLIDLAALTAGGWSEPDRLAIRRSYRAALEGAGGEALAGDDFAPALDCCGLHLAVQMLGWSADWTAPPAHARDWLGEAIRLAEALDL